jgi:hypothetical protein
MRSQHKVNVRDENETTAINKLASQYSGLGADHKRNSVTPEQMRYPKAIGSH